MSIDETTVDLWVKELLLLGAAHLFEGLGMQYMTIDHSGAAFAMKGYPTISHWPKNCYDLPPDGAWDYCRLTGLKGAPF